jgi:hypothetical protein
VGGAVSGAAGGAAGGGAAGGGAGGAGGGAAGPAAGNTMGMISQVQFMHLCSAGETGAPEETKAMSSGLGWANLDFDAPWSTDPDLHADNKTSFFSNRSQGRRLMAKMNTEAEASEEDATTIAYNASTLAQHAKAKQQSLFEGTVFYNVLVFGAVLGVHELVCRAVACATGSSTEDLPEQFAFRSGK